MFPSCLDLSDDHALHQISCFLVYQEIVVLAENDIAAGERDQDIGSVGSGPSPVFVETETDPLGDGFEIGKEVHEPFNFRATPDLLDAEGCFRLVSDEVDFRKVDVELPKRLELDVADMGFFAVTQIPTDAFVVAKQECEDVFAVVLLNYLVMEHLAGEKEVDLWCIVRLVRRRGGYVRSGRFEGTSDTVTECLL